MVSIGIERGIFLEVFVVSIQRWSLKRERKKERNKGEKKNPETFVFMSLFLGGPVPSWTLCATSSGLELPG
jgi:hypothetical protein